MDRVALILMIAGALNWLLVGVLHYDLVANLFGGQTAMLSRLTYILIGLSGLWGISLFFRDRIKDRR